MCDIWNIIMKGSDISWNVRRFSIIFPPLSLIMHSAPFFQKSALGPANMGRDSLKFNVCMKQWNSVWSQERWCWWTFGQWWTWEIMLKIFEESCWVVEIFSCSSSAWLHYVVRRQTKETVLWLYSIDHWPLIIFWLYSIDHYP